MLGIIGAMDVEVKKLREMMEDPEIQTVAGMTFYQGTIKGKAVVVVRSGIGKVNAGLCSQILVDRYHVSGIINTGIAPRKTVPSWQKRTITASQRWGAFCGNAAWTSCLSSSIFSGERCPWWDPDQNVLSWHRNTKRPCRNLSFGSTSRQGSQAMPR